jgi:DNA mismatch repair protein MutS
MLFTTDKQTLEDLNIFGRHGSNAIYSLFNRTLTVKGAEILEEMFRYPLSDADAINKRSAIITHLAAEGTVFPFKAELFDRAEQYLADTDERSRLSAEKQSLEKKLSNLVAADTQQKVILQWHYRLN